MLQRRETKKTHSPNLNIMPIQHGIYPHKLRPPLIRRREARQKLAMGVCSSGTHEHRLHVRRFFEVYVERLAHGQGVAG